MSAAEFYRWRGYLRQYPAGWKWLNLKIAEVKREIAKGHLGRGKKLPDLEHFMTKRPEPMFSLRAKHEAKAKQ